MADVIARVRITRQTANKIREWAKLRDQRDALCFAEDEEHRRLHEQLWDQMDEISDEIMNSLLDIVTQADKATE